jgi:anti-anti-sigma factor
MGMCRAITNIDATTGPAFRAELHDAIDNSDEPMVGLDCSAVTFMDVAGFDILVDATRYAIRRGRTLVIRDASPTCARLLSLYDPHRELHVEPHPRDSRGNDALSNA